MSRHFSLPTEKDELEVDQDALRSFAAGAKGHRTDQEPPPWEKHIPDELPQRNVAVRLNAYQHEMLRYVAKKKDVSQQKVLNRILVPTIEELAKELYGD